MVVGPHLIALPAVENGLRRPWTWTDAVVLNQSIAYTGGLIFTESIHSAQSKCQGNPQIVWVNAGQSNVVGVYNAGLTADRKHNSVLAEQLPNLTLRLPTWKKKRRR